MSGPMGLGTPHSLPGCLHLLLLCIFLFSENLLFIFLPKAYRNMVVKVPAERVLAKVVGKPAEKMGPRRRFFFILKLNLNFKLIIFTLCTLKLCKFDKNLKFPHVYNSPSLRVSLFLNFGQILNLRSFSLVYPLNFQV
jgi:hypothetical protein